MICAYIQCRSARGFESEKCTKDSFLFTCSLYNKYMSFLVGPGKSEIAKKKKHLQNDSEMRLIVQCLGSIEEFPD